MKELDFVTAKETDGIGTVSAIVNRCLRLTLLPLKPSFKVIDGIHHRLARFLNSIDDDTLFEYDIENKRYIVVSEHPLEDPDDYQLGHTAGKAGSFLGILPVGIGFLGIEVVKAVIGTSGVLWVDSIILPLLVLALAFFTVAAGIRFVNISVWWQIPKDREEEVRTV